MGLFESDQNDFITVGEALRIARKYPKGPHSRAGLKDAGMTFGFIKKSPDGYHCLYNRKKLIQYCEISNKPTLLDTAKKLGTNVGAIKYIALKNGIQFKEAMGRKYLEQEDVDKIIRKYKESPHGKKDRKQKDN